MGTDSWEHHVVPDRTRPLDFEVFEVTQVTGHGAGSTATAIEFSGTGPAMIAGLEFVKKLDRTRISESVGLREHFSRRLNATLASGDLLCIPTAPTIAPLKGSKAYDRTCDYYWRTLAATAIAGVARLPQVSMPLGQVDGVPVGLSLVAAHGRDLELLAAATRVAEQLHGFPGQLQ